MKANEDEYYIKRTLNGEASAYRFLVERYKRMVYSIALKLLANTGDAEDAAQDSFIKAYERLHTFEGKAKFSTWLYSLTYRLCLNKLKELKRELTFLTEDLSNGESEDMVHEAGHFNEEQQKKIIKEAIDALPGQEGLLVLLYYYEEKSIREIEQITGLKASNIKIKLFRARKVLESKLGYLMEEK
jgi:RNA polymerase sigma-70 factor (ECF subfamily)